MSCFRGNISHLFNGHIYPLFNVDIFLREEDAQSEDAQSEDARCMINGCVQSWAGCAAFFGLAFRSCSILTPIFSFSNVKLSLVSP